jgi:hypothetical protein
MSEQTSSADQVAELEAKLAELKAAQAPAEKPEPAQSLRAVAAATDPDKPLFVHCKGERFRLPQLTDVDIDVLEAFEQGKVVSSVKGILGDQAVTRIRVLHGGKIRIPDLEPIADQIARAYGFSSAGE